MLYKRRDLAVNQVLSIKNVLDRRKGISGWEIQMGGVGSGWFKWWHLKTFGTLTCKWPPDANVRFISVKC